MTRATDAYQALARATERTPPPCSGDDAFTRDDLTPEDVAGCAAICKTCPVFELCETYARTAKPPAGVWAGRRWGTTRKRDTA